MRDVAAVLARQLLAPVIRRFRRSESAVKSGYFASAPSPQNALDIFEDEWHTSLPGEYHGLRAGPIDLYKDPRLAWALSELGDLTGKHVLELGPLEGAHTYMLEQAGCASIRSVEANPRAYLKCLVIKEILGLQRSQFLCGDFVEYLRTSPLRADLVVASGVLYHMTNPVELIHLISRVTDSAFFWTHYYDQASIARRPEIARKISAQQDIQYMGFQHALFRYEYWSSFGLKRFCGGPQPHAFWMQRSAILDCLRFFGFNSILTNFEEVDHADGPAFAILARRT
jgi:hypothetical protein